MSTTLAIAFCSHWHCWMVKHRAFMQCCGYDILIRIRILLLLGGWQTAKISFFAYYVLKVKLHQFSLIKSPKKSPSSRNQGFFYYFGLLKEEPGSVQNNDGSGRPKNIQIRIHNTGYMYPVMLKIRAWNMREKWIPILESVPGWTQISSIHPFSKAKTHLKTHAGCFHKQFPS